MFQVKPEQSSLLHYLFNMTAITVKPRNSPWTSLLLVMILMISCSHEKQEERKILFSNNSWQRYDILKFEFPITEAGGSCDLLFELNCSKSFMYDDLPLNMVLNSPSGEERIKEYLMKIRDKNGECTGTIKGDSCYTRLVLKKGLYCSRKGVLKVEIENLNPKLQTEGIYSAGMILIKR